MLIRGTPFAARAAAAAVALLLAAASVAASAQTNDCYFALRKDVATHEGALVAATPAGPVEVSRERGYEWQSLLIHPETDALWAWGAGGATGGELYVYDNAGNEIAEHDVVPLREFTIDEALFLKRGERMLGAGYGKPYLGFPPVLFTLSTADPVGSVRTIEPPGGVLALVVVGPRIVAILAPAEHFGPSRAFIYDRRTRETETVTLPFEDAVQTAHVDVAGKLWVGGTGPRLELGLVENERDHPSTWRLVDRSGDIEGWSGGAMASSGGVLAVYSGTGLTTFRDGERLGGMPLDYRAAPAFPSVMVTEGGGAVIFGGSVPDDPARRGWLEARSPDLATLYGRWDLPAEPTWMAAASR